MLNMLSNEGETKWIELRRGEERKKMKYLPWLANYDPLDQMNKRWLTPDEP